MPSDVISAIHAAWSHLDHRQVAIIRGAVALAGTVVLAWNVWARRSPDRNDFARFRNALLATVGVLALACWWNLGRLHFAAGYLHMNELFHHYVGAKYAAELGYSRLYDCTAVADAEDGHRDRVSKRWIRNLQTNQLETTEAILSDPGRCTRHFTAERWAAFTHDVGWFRSHRRPHLWDLTQRDHGYNASPVWGIVGGGLARLAPASDTQIFALALLDPLLHLAMWGCVVWAFGWRAACVALLWWGTNYPARYAWTGGGYLRADWLALVSIGACLVRRGRHSAGGFALMYAALLRVFPVVIIGALALKMLVEMWGSRSLVPSRDHRAFALGGVLAVVLLVPLSVVAGHGGVEGGLQAWREFAANSFKHYGTPATNNMGLKVLVAYDPDSRVSELSDYWVDAPWDSWMAARRRAFAERAPIYWALVAISIVLIARAVRRHDDWVALALGAALLPIVLELTSYYYAVLLLVGLLWLVRPWIGVAVALTAAASNLVPAILRAEDDIYAAVSGTVLMLVFAVIATFAIESPRPYEPTYQR